MIYYTVSDEKTDAAGLSATLRASEDIAVPGADTVVRIENEGASMTLTCDLLKAIYVQDGKTQTALSVAGDVQDLCALTGKNEADFESVLESFAKAHWPYATSAAWDKRGLDRLRRAQYFNHVHARRRRFDHRDGERVPRRGHGGGVAMGVHVERKAIRKAAIFAALSFAVCCAVFVPTQPAWAGIAEDINGWLCDMLRGVCNWVFAAQVDVLKSIGYDGILGASFQNMLGTSGDVSVYDVVRGIWSVAVLPIGCGVLSLVFTIKLIQISQRMDGSASMPGVRRWSSSSSSSRCSSSSYRTASTS